MGVEWMPIKVAIITRIPFSKSLAVSLNFLTLVQVLPIN